MSRWFRFYDEVLDDPKVQLLPPEMFRAWVNLLCLACRHDGKLPPMAELAFSLRLIESEAEKLIGELTRRGLIDDSRGVQEPHNWPKRQFNSDKSTDRVREFRKRFRNVSSAVSETAPDTDTDTDTEEVRERERAQKMRSTHSRLPSRLSTDFKLSPADIAFAATEGLRPEQVAREAARFHDHWLAASGTNARKRDWSAAWRNWVRKAVDGFGQPRAPPGASQPLSPRDQQRRKAMEAYDQLRAATEPLWAAGRSENGSPDPDRLLAADDGKRAADFSRRNGPIDGDLLAADHHAFDQPSTRSAGKI